MPFLHEKKDVRDETSTLENANQCKLGKMSKNLKPILCERLLKITCNVFINANNIRLP